VGSVQQPSHLPENWLTCLSCQFLQFQPIVQPIEKQLKIACGLCACPKIYGRGYRSRRLLNKLLYALSLGDSHVRKICFSFLLIIVSDFVQADYYQYARFAEVTYQDRTRNKNGVILSFSTDPAFPITITEKSNSSIEASRNAYKKLFERADWGEPKESDVMYVLNFLGSRGWRVIHIIEVEETVFTNRIPAKRYEFLLEKKLVKPSY